MYHDCVKWGILVYFKYAHGKNCSDPEDPRDTAQDLFTFPQTVDLEGRHLLGEDGLWQVEKGWVIDREVTVVLVQNPNCCPLNTTLHETEEEKLPPLLTDIFQNKPTNLLSAFNRLMRKWWTNISRKWHPFSSTYHVRKICLKYSTVL